MSDDDWNRNAFFVCDRCDVVRYGLVLVWRGRRCDTVRHTEATWDDTPQTYPCHGNLRELASALTPTEDTSRE